MIVTKKDELCEWFDFGKSQSHEYMIVVCDTFDWEDYPVYSSAEDFEKQHSEHDDVNMQKIMEVYDLSMDREEQMRERRAFHFPSCFALQSGEQK